MKNISIIILAIFLLRPFLAAGTVTTQQRRLNNTCGDPALTTTYYSAFDHTFKMHEIETQAAFVNDGANGGDWEIDSPAFHAWKSPGQLNTVPLYAFGSQTAGVVMILSANGNPPATPAGFTTSWIVAYVYATQICGSVPLYGASSQSASDNWYTTELIEHNELLGFGWKDTGIVAYVLPVNDCSCST